MKLFVPNISTSFDDSRTTWLLIVLLSTDRKLKIRSGSYKKVIMIGIHAIASIM